MHREAAAYLMDGGVDVLLLDNSVYTPSDVARRIADAIPAGSAASVGPLPRPFDPKEHERTTGTPVIDTHVILRDGEKILFSQRGGP
ncbi:hypothetical protein ACWKT5_31340 [Streptomyces avermitilis]